MIILVVNTCMSASDDSLDTYRSKWADLFKRTKAVRDVSVKSLSKSTSRLRSRFFDLGQSPFFRNFPARTQFYINVETLNW